MIEKYFKKIVDYKYNMQKAFKRYIEAQDDFYIITGIKYTTMPKSEGKPLGFDDLMVHIEDLYNEYIKCKNKYDKEYKIIIKDINKLDNQLYRLIIEYTYIDRKIDKKPDKETLKELQDYHKIDISYPYFRKIKSNAKSDFLNIISNKL